MSFMSFAVTFIPAHHKDNTMCNKQNTMKLVPLLLLFKAALKLYYEVQFVIEGAEIRKNCPVGVSPCAVDAKYY